MGGLVAPYDSHSSPPLCPTSTPLTCKRVWQEEVEMVHPQGWEAEGRARAPKNRVVILLSPAPAPSSLGVSASQGVRDGPETAHGVGVRRVCRRRRQQRRRAERARSPW